MMTECTLAKARQIARALDGTGLACRLWAYRPVDLNGDIAFGRLLAFFARRRDRILAFDGRETFEAREWDRLSIEIVPRPKGPIP